MWQWKCQMIIVIVMSQARITPRRILSHDYIYVAPPSTFWFLSLITACTFRLYTLNDYGFSTNAHLPTITTSTNSING